MYLSEKEKQTIIEMCKRNGISNCGVFGSFARGEADESSDVDLLVKFSKPIGWKFFGLADEFGSALGKKVDLATDKMIGKRIRQSVLGDLQMIYEEGD